jgi:gamma-D-glutamyl-L-lysine dipeptidyl-peptidase
MPSSRSRENTLIIGVVSVSAAAIYRNPAHNAEMVNQALLGTPVKVLKKKGNWFFVQSPDGYYGWMDEMLVPMTKKHYAQWMKKEKIIITADNALMRSGPRASADVVSDVVAGDILALKNETATHYKVEYPDARNAFLPKSKAERLNGWLQKANDTPESIIATAKRFYGLPYLWGGASPKALDCSGFVKLVYYLNGVQLPRDADEQSKVGKPVAINRGMTKTRPGDLLFFGEAAKKGRIARCTHVGISLGGNKFIQESGDVHISSLDPADVEYCPRRARSLIKVKRIIGAEAAEGTKHGVRRLCDLLWFAGHTTGCCNLW